MATLRAMPVLQVRDVVVSAAFYEKLGFHNHGFWGEPPDFAIVQRGEVTLALDKSESGGAVPLNQWWAAYVYVDDVDALHREFAGLELEGVSEPCDEVYGCRDFDVVDPDGHRIAFGQDLGNGPPGLGADRGRG